MGHNIIDSHLHLPVFSNLKTLEDKKAQLLADLKINRIMAAIVIADSESPSVIGTNEECIRLFENYRNIFIMLGISPLLDYNDNLVKAESYLMIKKAVAVKVFPGHEHYFINDPRLEDVILTCEKYDVPLAVHSGWSNPQYNAPALFADVAQRHPALKMIYCHLWYPNTNDCYEATKRFDNVNYDISSLAYKKENLPIVTDTLTRIARENPHRLIFGTDYGACDHISHFALVGSLPVEEDIKELIFSKNSIRVFNLSDLILSK